ncbi:MAG: hypothetical protein GY811_17500 [Myxococcales bacterium]|nr:hypothetical protein [Myxococcales bacterium]
MNKHLVVATILSTLALAEGGAWAQPEDGAQDAGAVPPTTLSPMRAPSQDAPAEGTPTTEPDEHVGDEPADPYANLTRHAQELKSGEGEAQGRDPYVAPPTTEHAPAKAPAFKRMKAPQLLAVPTARLLPAAIVHGTTSLDTGGSFGGSLRVGLGDVGEFGIETSPRIRMQSRADNNPETVQPLVLASFRMGVGEDRPFEHQPALALGFRKSFSREQASSDIRVASIDLVASKTFGKTSLHAGGVFWDASMTDVNTEEEVLLHDTGTKRQIRPFGGIEAEPIENAQLLVDLYWVPLFSPFATSDKDAIKLRPTLSWGIRYHLSEKVSFESGVRVPDIGEANLLDAQIFGQLSIASDKIRRALGVSK